MIRAFIDGVTAYGEALQIIRKQRLWKYFVVPALISLVLAAIIFGSSWYLSDDVGGWLSNLYPWEFGKLAVEKISSIFGGLLLVALGLILYKNLVMALASPFMSLLSERIERNLGAGIDDSPLTVRRILSETIRGLRIALRNIIRELLITLLLLLLGLIPIFAPFTAILIFATQAFYAGFGSMDYILERHFNMRDSVRFVRANRGLAIGNGTVFLLILMTGVGFLIALPLSTVAATTETLKRLT